MNAIAPGTIDMKKVKIYLVPCPIRVAHPDLAKIHKGPRLTRFNIVENHNTVLAGAKKIGVNLVNIGVVDLEEGKVLIAMPKLAKLSNFGFYFISVSSLILCWVLCGK